jgi:hypothetical protein
VRTGGPEITIEGVYAGHELFLRLLAEPPEDEEPGMELDATRSLVTGGSTDPEDVHPSCLESGRKPGRE